MPYRIGRPQSKEVLGRKALGIKLPFNAPGIFSSSYKTIDAYRNNLLTYFLTAKGDRYLDPAFGNSIIKYLFEPTLSEGDINFLKSEIINDINTYFSRLIVLDLEINQHEDEHILQVYLRFGVQNLNEEDEITINYNQ